MHDKPLGVLNVNGYYDALGAFLDRAVQEKFVRAQHRAFLIFDESPKSLLARLAQAEPPPLAKWLTPAET